MAQEKKMNEKAYAEMLKGITVAGEMLRTHQDEKQSVMDDFDLEVGRYKSGKISEKAVISSAKRVNKLLVSLNKAIHRDIQTLDRALLHTKKFADGQYPKHYRATVSGIRAFSQRKKKHSKKSKK